jgi:hypothetical protein
MVTGLIIDRPGAWRTPLSAAQLDRISANMQLLSESMPPFTKEYCRDSGKVHLKLTAFHVWNL